MMFTQLRVLFITIGGIAIFFLPQQSQENEAPRVEIITPLDNDTFLWNTLVPFSISVRDKEDGYSDYDEILPTKVLLTVEYLPKGKEVAKGSSKASNTTIETLSLMGSLDCLTCHKAKERLIGPSFAEIAERYGNRTGSADLLEQKILRGAEGTWGDQIMPAHPNITKEKVGKMVNWILKNGSDADLDFFSGTSGAFKTRDETKASGTAAYILTAFYTDNGINENTESSKTGSHTILLRQK